MTTPLHQTRVRAVPQGIESLAHSAAARTTSDGLRELLAELPAGLLTLAHCATFDPGGRTRRVLFENAGASVVLVGWLPGQGSGVHDYGGSLHAFRVLRGIATEARYELDEEGFAVEIGRDDFLPGSVLASEGVEIHSLCNDGAASEPLVTLHVCRPAAELRSYRVRGGGAS